MVPAINHGITQADTHTTTYVDKNIQKKWHSEKSSMHCCRPRLFSAAGGHKGGNY